MTPVPHEPSGKSPYPAVELALEHEGQAYLLHPGLHAAEFDELLRRLGATSWVFLPFGAAPEKERKQRAHAKRIAAVRAQLASSSLLEGGRRTQEEPGVLEPGLFVLDLPRTRGRELAKELAQDEFYWGSLGVPLETHAALVFGIDDIDEESKLETARVGLGDLKHTLGQILHDPRALREQIGPDFGSLLTTLAALVTIGLASLCLSWFFHQDTEPPLALEPTIGNEQETPTPGAQPPTTADPSSTEPEPTSAVSIDDSDDDDDDDDRGPQTRGLKLLSLFLHPILLPAFLLARYLRRHYYTGALKNPSRELTTHETLERWEQSRLHLLAVWSVAAFAILLFTSAKLLWKGDLSATELVDDASTYLAICVWVLTPLAFSKDLGTAISTLIEGAVAVFLTVLFMKISLLIANWASALFWSIVGKLIPIEIPDILMELVSSGLAISAELFFLVHLLGYTWLKERTQFALRASGEL